MGLTDPYEAFCFDQAIAEVGNTVMGELNLIEAKNQKEHDAKAARIFQKYFGKTPGGGYNEQQFKKITAPTK